MRQILGGFIALFSLAANALQAPVRPEVFNPIYEGQYDVTLECREVPASALCKKVAGKYRMVIVNTDTEAGVIITINHWEHDVAHYGFRVTQVMDRGGRSWGSSTGVHDKPAQYEMTVSDDGSLLMWLRTGESLQDFRVTGQRVHTPGIFYLDAGAPEQLAPYEVVGLYKDTMFGAELTVRQPLGADSESYENYMATWHSPSSGAKIYFTTGNYRPSEGVLNLLSYAGTGYDILKWSLALRRGTDGKLRWTGIGYSTITGRSRVLSLGAKE